MLESDKNFEELGWECVGVARSITESYISERVCHVIDAAGKEEGNASDPEWNQLGEAEKTVMRDIVMFVS
jgi:hypothetical protein